jgi:predicted ATPase/class 3 adenylate cyclase
VRSATIVLVGPHAGGHVERRAPPSGLVTFLFTDIEDSTRLLNDLGDVYRDLLDHHDALLREVWQAHDGYEVNTQGDAFFVAFASADRALAACLEAQRRLREDPWPHRLAMRVRMGLHAGLAAPRRGDYIALAAHQAARIVNAAHGGQVIVTAEVLAAADEDWSRSIVDLGRFQVRNFPDAIALFQLVDPDRLAGAGGDGGGFGPPRVPPARMHNLVRPPGSFVGRDEVRARVGRAIGPGRVVTVVGPGGVGKTRLCTELAFDTLDDWPDGVRVVELAAVDREGSIVVAVAAAVQLVPPGSGDLVGDVLEHLASRSMLLILDNAEHLVADTARFVRALGDRAPGVGVLVTSREPLGLRGERVVRLEPLEPADAARLFVDRAEDYLSGRPVTLDDPAVHALCRRLDGLPLALEMAAARTELFSAAEILDALEARTSPLSMIDPTIEDRHRSIGELIRWSEQLLDPRVRTLLGRLSVYAGSFSPDGVRALLAADGELRSDVDLEDALFELTRKSLLLADGAGALRRYRLLQVVRDEIRSGRDVIDRRRDAAVAGRWLAERFGPEVPADGRWAIELGDELDNLRHLAVVLADDDTDVAGHLAAALIGRQLRFGEIATAVAELTTLLGVFARRSWVRVQLLVDLAWCRMEGGDHDGAIALLDEAGSERHGLDLPAGFEFHLELTRAVIQVRAGRAGDAIAALATLGDGGDRALTTGERMRRSDLIALARFALGDPVGAVAAAQEALVDAGAMGSTLHLGIITSNLAEYCLAAGDRPGAAQCQLAALDHEMQLGSVVSVAHAAALAAVLADTAGRPDDALWLQTWADVELGALGATLHGADRTRADALVARARTTVGDPTAAAIAAAAGRTALGPALERIRATLTELSR